MAGRDTFLNCSAPIMFQFSTESILFSLGKEQFVYFHLVGEIISVLSMLYVGLRLPGRCHGANDRVKCHSILGQCRGRGQKMFRTDLVF